MTDIQVLIPLSVFGDAENLTPQAISEAITKAVDSKEKIANMVEREEALIQQMISWSNSLDQILELDEPYRKAQALRAFQEAMNDWAQIMREQMQ